MEFTLWILSTTFIKNIHYSTVSNNSENPDTTKINYGKFDINQNKLLECNNERMNTYVGMEKSQRHVNMKTWFKTVDEYDPFYVIKYTYICMQKQDKIYM